MISFSVFILVIIISGSIVIIIREICLFLKEQHRRRVKAYNDEYDWHLNEMIASLSFQSPVKSLTITQERLEEDEEDFVKIPEFRLIRKEK